MKQSPTSTEGHSPNQAIWQRFKKNKPAVFGMWVVVAAVVMAVMGYVLSPDKTPNVNEQIPEVALKSPGFTVQILAVAKNRVVEKRSLLGRLLFGQENPFKYIPINHYKKERDVLAYERYEGTDPESGEPIAGQRQRVRLADIVFPLSFTNPDYQVEGERIFFNNMENRAVETSVPELFRVVEEQHLFKKTYYLGTDKYGRSVLSRLILGVRVSLLVGMIAVFIALTIGILLGALAGYFGGRVDDVILLLINTVWSIPTLLLVFAIVLALGRGIGIIFLAVGLTMWVDVARIVRGQVMALREIQFVEAAQSMGFRSGRIIFRHILPNVLGPVMVIAASTFATAILIEAGLSYLGFGIQPPTPSWGTMLNENYGYAISGKPFLALIPAVAIMLLVLAFNLVGNGLRDAVMNQ